jgi:penicillin-binding protein A
MQFTKEINRLLFGVLIAFMVIVIAATYWAVAGPLGILQREDNPRLIEAESRIIRGNIEDRSGSLLVTSLPGENGFVSRQYLYPEMNSALGYFSLRYGVGGAEAAYDLILSGSDLNPDFNEYMTANLLHHPQEGSSIRLSLDLNIQQQVEKAMNGQAGAAVILAVPSGEVLAMVSLPTYDPNMLDANWEALTTAPGNPFFNRVLQGGYQPGGALQTMLMATALVTGQPLDASTATATQPVHIADVDLNCAVRLPPMALDLREAYAFACPFPFVELADDLGPTVVQAALNTFLFDQPLALPGFVVEPEDSPTPMTTPFILADTDLVEDALGQGAITINPLTMAVMMSAIVNDGNAPQPYTLLEVQRPDSTEWLLVSEVLPTIPLMTTDTARQLQDLMRNAVANGAAQNAGRPEIDIGGHAALAYSGEETQAWFVGFATLGGRRGIAVAVVLENSNDPGLAADIGGTALEAAHEALQNS